MGEKLWKTLDFFYNNKAFFKYMNSEIRCRCYNSIITNDNGRSICDDYASRSCLAHSLD